MAARMLSVKKGGRSMSKRELKIDTFEGYVEGIDRFRGYVEMGDAGDYAVRSLSNAGCL
jgi:hypothetical protein